MIAVGKQSGDGDSIMLHTVARADIPGAAALHCHICVKLHPLRAGFLRNMERDGT